MTNKSLCGCLCWRTESAEEESPTSINLPVPITSNHGAVTGTEDLTFCRSAFLPECIRNWIKEENYEIPCMKTVDVAMLALEIPEIRDLVDLYSLSNASKVDYLADELNYYMSTYFNIITSHGGDIISLVDCIITCIWPIEDEETGKTIEYVLNTAITIQQCYGENKTKAGIMLTNRIGVSFGTLNQFLVGNPSDKIYYVMTGNVVEDTLVAKSFCKSHEVILTPSSWDTISNNKHYKWRKKSSGYICVLARRKDICPVLIDEVKLKDHYEMIKDFQNAYNDSIGAYLHPLPKNSRTKQQMHILSAVSQVVVLAAYVTNFDLTKPEPLHEATVLLQKLVNEYEGIFTKIMSDKNISFGIVFGCPGFKHINDQARGLMLSQKIVRALRDMNLEINVGISTGVLFCGILGPGHRLECALLGTPVRIAKTLITYYCEYDIVCCINTYFRARREVGDIFRPVRKRIKGLKSTTVFFEVSTAVRSYTPIIKCVGRRREKESLINALYDLKQMKTLKLKLPLISITGKTGLGKTHLLTWLIQESADMGYQALVANSVFEEPFEDAWHLIKQLLHNTKADNEDKIIELLPGDAANTYPLHMLNKWICTKFKVKIPRPSTDLIVEMMITLTNQCTKDGKNLIVAVDNAEHMGTESWEYLQILATTRAACVVVTFTEEFHSTVSFIKQLIRNQYLGITLNPCDEEGLGSLACQFLNVKAIHKSFLKFLAEHSCGNALRLQEVLMLPQLQRHFCIVPSESLTAGTLLSNFEMAEDFVDFPNAKVCDILDKEGLFSVNVPHQLLDVVKDHTCGLNPEEQMLTRKVACLGKTFGIHILEAVCPEYTSEELRTKVEKLVKKKVLAVCCNHLSTDSDPDKRSSLKLKEIVEEFCMHPFKFSHEYLRKCVINSMPSGQREQLNIFLASLLEDSLVRCDSCSTEAEIAFDPHFVKIYGEYKIPHMDLRFCQCINLRMNVLIQKEYHLMYGNAAVSTRIAILIKAAELALETQSNADKAESLLKKCKHLLINRMPKKEDVKVMQIAIERLDAQVKVFLGMYDDALFIIQEALQKMGIEYPMDFTMHLYKKKRIDPRMGDEEKHCLYTLCIILKNLGNYEMAYKIIKYQLELVLKYHHEYIELVQSYYLLLSVATKTRRGKKRVKNWLQPAYFTCYERITDFPVVSIAEFRAVAKLYIVLVEVLFETNSLSQAESVGVTMFQILKQVNGDALLAHITSFLGLIYFYNLNISKSFEMVSLLRNAFQQSGKSSAEPVYYVLLVKLLRHLGEPNRMVDEVGFCNKFAQNAKVAILENFKEDLKIALAAKMALWSNENQFESACAKWHKCATKLYHEIPFYNFWVLSAAIDLLIINIHEIKNKYRLYTSQQFKIIKWDVQKELTLISENVFQYCPVLQVDILAADQLFKRTIEVCNTLKLKE